MATSGVNIKDVVRGIADQPLLVWRVEAFSLAEVPPASFGTFMAGDSYVVLSVLKNAEGTKRKIYIWQGSSSTQDELASSAILAKELDDALGGSPEQVRVTQGEEPEDFKKLFSGGLNFQKGGVASGFRKNAKAKTEPKLFVVKAPAPGKIPQVTEVLVSAKSLVCNASFVLDDDASNTLTIWHGSKAGLKEKSKALDTANTFRSNRGQLRVRCMRGVRGTGTSSGPLNVDSLLRATY